MLDTNSWMTESIVLRLSYSSQNGLWGLDNGMVTPKLGVRTVCAGLQKANRKVP
jgi:hypothetical protein